MNTVQYDLMTGDVVAFASGVTQDPLDGCGVLYTAKELTDIVNCVVLDGDLIPRMSQAYALSDKSSDMDKAAYWREHRNALLSASDFMMLPDVGDDAFRQAAIEYRASLRAIAYHKNWPRLSMDDIPTAPDIPKPKIPLATL